MTRSLVFRGLWIVWSVLVWCALWSTVSVANVLWGAVIGVATVRVVPLHDAGFGVRINPLAALRYFAYAMRSLVESSAVVAWEIVTPGSRINSGIVEAPLRTHSQGVQTLVANTVSLTPGTLTLEIRQDPPSLFIHVMHLAEIDDVRAEISRLEDLAFAAFPDADRHDETPATDAEVPT